ncbi:MAG: gamma-glutamylcyclotransferase [Deltaproteobacteria bacterium]|jgi:glutathione-specific gamma-glutamylcyclotransferase|nr:gamma-glutamylcyclotransferase [Deltaproteobacteria bacterium]MBT4642019.1 gamma-glutamylcyclotransferase [Deltaproteobacteria bacterium]MBT6499762.1 gamma-glutamylcyclotransferase [Deltaproteobacteria bacterium]MBT6611859.1 gamma-glutamylcyclotransferase [Deltaproteobacteria bacterium]MBT7151462.1 gamma-glutamylcyclotransferase [Deltaproteobacteria bacterium]
MLKREDFSRERIDAIIAEVREHGSFEALSHEERELDRRQFLSRLPAGEDLWVFGYGSLIWNPAFYYAEVTPARLYGYHRSFCLHLTIGRGSADTPGLMLALDKGGSCNGMAFRIAAEQIESETEILWMREMISGAYIPHYGNLKTDKGVIKGLTFVINRKHSRYLGNLGLQRSAGMIRNGRGSLGTCREYLENTIEQLQVIGVQDSYLLRIRQQINQSDQQEN